MAEDKITPDGQRLMVAWKEARHNADRAMSAYREAARRADAAREEFIKWILPPNAQVGEKIGVWVGNEVFIAEVKELNPLKATLTIRER